MYGDIVAFCTRKQPHKEGKMMISNKYTHCVVETYNGVVIFGKKGVSDSTSEKRINFEKHHITLDDINDYMHDSYKRKYGHTWDLNSKDAYTFQQYSDLIPVFELALILAYDDVMLIVDNFDDCSREMKLRLIFAVVDMAARYDQKRNKTVDEKMEEVLSSLGDV